MDKLLSQIVYLIACALHEVEPKKELLGEIDFRHLYRITKEQSLVAITCMALESADLLKDMDSEIAQKWIEAKEKAICKNILLDTERAQLLQEMEKNEIWYMPLKGVFLQNWYPKYGMRQMSDNDILYDVNGKEIIRNWFLQRGYEEKIPFGKTISVHDCYKKKPVYNFEMHRALFSGYFNENWEKKYENVKEKLCRTEGTKFGYHFTEEDFYVYVMAHAYKHYSRNGTGLRTLVDTYVMNWKKASIWDRKYIEKELDELGILVFEQECRTLAEKIFRSPDLQVLEILNEKEMEMLLYCYDSKTYGTKTNHINNRLREIQMDNKPITMKTWIQYYRKKLFPGKFYLIHVNPFVAKHKCLWPFYWIYRIIRIVFFRKKTIKEEWRTIRKIAKMTKKSRSFDKQM